MYKILTFFASRKIKNLIILYSLIQLEGEVKLFSFFDPVPLPWSRKKRKYFLIFWIHKNFKTQ